MANLRKSDLVDMLNTSADIGYVSDGTSPLEVNVQIADEDGSIYDIQDVKYNIITKSIHIRFNHDNEDDSEAEEWSEPSPPFPSIEPIE